MMKDWSKWQLREIIAGILGSGFWSLFLFFFFFSPLSLFGQELVGFSQTAFDLIALSYLWNNPALCGVISSFSQQNWLRYTRWEGERKLKCQVLEETDNSMKKGILPYCLLVYNTVLTIFVLLTNDSNLLKWTVRTKVIKLFLSMVLRLFECNYLSNRSTDWRRDKLRKESEPRGNSHCL